MEVIKVLGHGIVYHTEAQFLRQLALPQAHLPEGFWLLLINPLQPYVAVLTPLHYATPCAIHTYDDGYLMYDTTGYVCYDFIGERVVGGEGNNQQQLMQWAKAILQAASNDLNER